MVNLGKDRSRFSFIRGGVFLLFDRTGRLSLAGKLVERKVRSLDEGIFRDVFKLSRRVLSYVDFFGDESEDEDSGFVGFGFRFFVFFSFSFISDSDSDFSLGFLVVGGSFKRFKVFSFVSSGSFFSFFFLGAGLDVDYVVLEKEVDFDCDFMEECLRIFREFISVKIEDKGRLVR